MTTNMLAEAAGPIGDVWRDFWRDFCAEHGVDAAAARVDVFHFGTADMADGLAALVCTGQKRATAGLAEGDDPPPVVGGHFIVTSAAGVPVAVARTVQVDHFPFRNVPAWFAEREGEDEGTGEVCLASWKAGHGRFFRRVCADEGREFDEGEMIVCESFETLHVRADWRAHLVLP